MGTDHSKQTNGQSSADDFNEPNMVGRLTASVNCCAISPCGNVLVSGSDDGIVAIWTKNRSKPTKMKKKHVGPVRSCQFSPFGSKVVSSGDDGKCRISDMTTGKTIKSIKAARDSVTSCCFNGCGEWVALASSDHTVRLWDPRVHIRGTLMAYGSHWSAVRCVAFAPNGYHLVSGSDDGSVRVWDVRKPVVEAALAFLSSHTESIRSCAFSPDGRQILSASDDSLVKLWDYQTRRVTRSFRGHSAPVCGAAFCDDGARIVSAGEDRALKVWDARTGALFAMIDPTNGTRGRRGSSRCNSCSVFGDLVVTADSEGCLKLWSIPLPTLPTPAAPRPAQAANPSSSSSSSSSVEWPATSPSPRSHISPVELQRAPPPPPPPAPCSSSFSPSSDNKRKTSTASDALVDQGEEIRREIVLEIAMAASECVICYEQTPDVALLPCLHMCLCGDCVQEWEFHGAKRCCPLCRESVSHIVCPDGTRPVIPFVQKRPPPTPSPPQVFPGSIIYRV